MAQQNIPDTSPVINLPVIIIGVFFAAAINIHPKNIGKHDKIRHIRRPVMLESGPVMVSNYA